MTDKPETMTAQWRYQGRRTIKGGLGQFWLDHDGKERGFKKWFHGVVGGVYDVEYAEKPTGGIQVVGAKFVRSLDDELAGQWYVEDMAAYTADERRKAEAKAKRDRVPWENMSLKELRAHIRKLPHSQRTAMVAYFNGYLYG